MITRVEAGMLRRAYQDKIETLLQILEQMRDGQDIYFLGREVELYSQRVKDLESFLSGKSVYFGGER